MSDWSKIRQLTIDLIRRNRRARSEAARRREMPKICAILGIPDRTDSRYGDHKPY